MVGRKYLVHLNTSNMNGCTISGLGCTGNEALGMSPIQVGTILGLRMQVNLGVPMGCGLRALGLSNNPYGADISYHQHGREQIDMKIFGFIPSN